MILSKVRVFIYGYDINCTSTVLYMIHMIHMMQIEESAWYNCTSYSIHMNTSMHMRVQVQYLVLVPCTTVVLDTGAITSLVGCTLLT